MKKKWSTVEVLRHSRHDWLNNLQLIKGNIDLNKIDRVKEIIQEIVVDAQNEARLSNLHIPEFAGNLMTFNWDMHHFQLEFEVLGELKDLSSYDLDVANWTNLFFQTIDQATGCDGDNHLSLSIDLSAENIRFFFDFSGIIKDTATLKTWLHDNGNNHFLKIIEQNIMDDEISVTLELK